MEPQAERHGPRRGHPKSHLWTSEEGGLDQVGCIYTAQGFEFDYAGVIWGNDLVYRLADVMVYLTRLADVLEVDLVAAAMRKIEVNERRFPAA